jgi:hypothetical protein
MQGDRLKLYNYLLNKALMNLDERELERLIKNLTATEILNILREVKEVHQSLSETGVGRVLL